MRFLLRLRSQLVNLLIRLEVDMDKLISFVKAVEAVAATIIATAGTGADPHNPLTWIAVTYAVGQTLNSIFHWKKD